MPSRFGALGGIMLTGSLMTGALAGAEADAGAGACPVDEGELDILVA